MTHIIQTPRFSPFSYGSFLGVRIRPSPYWPHDETRTVKTIPGHPLVQWLSRMLGRIGLHFDPDLHVETITRTPKPPALDRQRSIIYCAPAQEAALIAAYAPFTLYRG